MRCAYDLSSKPWWMSWGQYDPCQCERPEGHDGPHWCKHEAAPRPADAIRAVALPEETP